MVHPHLDGGPYVLLVWAALRQDPASVTLGGSWVPLGLRGACARMRNFLMSSWTDQCGWGRGPDDQGATEWAAGICCMNCWQWGGPKGLGRREHSEEGGEHGALWWPGPAGTGAT